MSKPSSTGIARLTTVLLDGGRVSDRAIETALMLKSVFKLPQHALEEFIKSLFTLMDIPLPSPDYSCISKRAKLGNIQYRLPGKVPGSSGD